MKTRVRAAGALAGALAILAILAGGALAAGTYGGTTPTLTSKTINTSNGECLAGGKLADGVTACGSAVYGEGGFTGRIYGSGTQTIFDYLCVHTPADAAFKSFGGTLTLTILDVSNAVIGGPVTETVTGGIDCTGNTDGGAVTTAGVSVNFDTNGGVVAYHLVIDGVTSANAQATFSANNSIRNEVFSAGCAQHVRSASVAPPGPPVLLPEAPAAVMMLFTGGLTALAYLGWRSVRRPRTASAASTGTKLGV